MFLHVGVRRLVIPPEQELNNGPSFFTYPDFFRELLLRAPLLESLEIGASSLLQHMRTFRPEDPEILARHVSQFPTLNRLSVPAAAVLFHLQDISTTLPKLRTLLESDTFQRRMLTFCTSHWPTLHTTKIENLAVSVDLNCASELLIANRMSHLRILCLETNISQSNMKKLFRTLGERCPALEELTIWMGFVAFSELEEIDISVFEPLVHCVSLAVLDISAPCVLIFDEDEGAARLATILANYRSADSHLFHSVGP
ncbi:hypothetical protein B0H17DRAFT_670025 [Mycena rosella]|uniref:Uncharacterized protein n=1 Tax=Mycena rosella TaxID=1033263 RepID=A0AAD7GUR2_MYCRO|nr:hypothetical protein B0H17DRAFT_670025 [Mycena rosella]